MGPTKAQRVDIVGSLVTGPTIAGDSSMFGLNKIHLHWLGPDEENVIFNTQDL